MIEMHFAGSQWRKKELRDNAVVRGVVQWDKYVSEHLLYYFAYRADHNFHFLELKGSNKKNCNYISQ
jgi:hypothetical protein